MRTSIRLLVPLVIAIFLTSCALQRPQVWEPHERLGLGKVDTKQKPSSTNIIERLIPVRIDGEHPSAGNFDLYYFVRMPAKGKARKTVLFCAGGPGQIVYGPMSGVTFADFLTDNGYNVVYFHQRGAGFSQIPASNQYDRFLKTEYAVEDIEAIRRDFLGESGNWDAIIGWSYGTIVAQEYTHFYPRNVKRLILIGPMSRHKFKNSGDAFDDVLKEIRSTDRYTLTKIYASPAFDDLSPDQKNLILDKVFGSIEEEGIFDRTEEAFGSLQFVIDSYCELKNKNELEKYRVNEYSSEFFRQLRNLRMYGWRPEDVSADKQVRIGHRLKEEILYSHRMIDDCSAQQLPDSPGLSTRAFYVIGTYDGINISFLKEWLTNGKQHVVDALKKSGGEANELRNTNEYIGKIGISDSETIEPWDPARYKHDQPTLILKGSADTVPAGRAAEYIFRNALTGPRTFIEFPGVGHSLGVPETVSEPILTGTLHPGPLSLPAGGVQQVWGAYKGRNPNENFRVQLETHDLEQGLKLSGFGIRAKNTNGSLDVVALIENTGSQSVARKNRKWRVGNSLFSGIVDLESPRIDPNRAVLVYGTTTAAWLKRAVDFEKPVNLEPGLERLCSQVRHIDDGSFESDYLEIWIGNKSSGPIDGTAKSWTVVTNQFSSTFGIDPDPIEPKEIFYAPFVVKEGFKDAFLDGLQLERTEWVTLKPGSKLVGCVQEEGEDKASVFVYNPEDSDSEAGSQTLTIGNSMFTRTYKIDHFYSIPSRQGVVVQLNNPTYRWNQTPVLNGPANLESGVELLGWNVVDEKQVSILIRNNGENSIMAVTREWVYIDPNEKGTLACMTSSALRDCLIYSFLVMSPEAFKNDQDNKLLSMLKAEPLPARVCYRNGDDQGYREPADDTCP
jgi:pimeloyl-ACP methyl ester carboxylesterase